MSKKYQTIVCDPPWSFGDSLGRRGAAANYSVMGLDDICAMARVRDEYVYALALCGKKFRIADDALLFLWRVSSQVEEAYEVVQSWGFEPKSEIVWIKTTGTTRPLYEKLIVPTLHFGMGRYVRNCHETCIIAARGRATKLIKNHSTRSVFYAPVGKHSEKPQAFFDLVEALAPGPRLELFARKQREGWRCVGDQA